MCSLVFRNFGIDEFNVPLFRELQPEAAKKEIRMENFLRQSTRVPFLSIYLDPNNPRLASEEAPGYDDPAALFDEGLQKKLEEDLAAVYDVNELIDAIIAQGWMPIDAIVVWTYPEDQTKHIVVEGNTRTLALRKLRRLLPKEQKKLDSMRKPRAAVAKHDIEAQEKKIAQVQKIISDTENLTVIPLDANTLEELKRKLPRVLAVRHIQGVKEWGNYAADLWILDRYAEVFTAMHPGEELRWDDDLILKVAGENSLGFTKTKRKLQAASAFSHFKAEYASKLPDGEAFSREDYYLFENIVRRPWLREQLGLSENGRFFNRENVLFEWIFKLPRPTTARENPNKFYRHENVLVWDTMHKYDVTNKTGFASRFNVDEPENAPTMFEVEADFNSYRARRQPTDVIEALLEVLGDLKVDVLINATGFLEPKLQRVVETATKLLNMIESVKTVAKVG
jgi:hypothetical protein